MSRDVSKTAGVRAGLACAAACAALACVGSDRTYTDETEARSGREDRAATVRSGIDFDTIPVAPYEVFETQLESDDPPKLLVRLLVLERTSSYSLSKTLRQAIDSIVATDSTLVAARAVLYTGRPLSAREIELTPAAFALWVPPEGWDSATATASERIHRTFVYHGDPGWLAGTAEPPNSAGGDD